MNVWVFILLFAAGVTAFILVMALLSNLLIHWSAHRFFEKTRDKNLDELESLLPGKNCGKCGCETCEEYARAVFTLHKDTDCCTEGDAQLPRKLEACMERFQKILERDEDKREKTGRE